MTITSDLVTVERYAFSSCPSLTEVNYAGTEEDRIGISIANGNDRMLNAAWNFSAIITGEHGYAPATAGYCGSSTIITWAYEDGTLTISGEGGIKDYSGSYQAPWYNYRNEIEKIEVDDGVTVIGSHAFYNLTGVTEISVSSNVRTIGSYAFAACTSLTDVHLAEGLTSIGNGAFEGCTALTEIELPNGILTLGDNAFQNCSNLTSINIPASIQSWDGGPFYGCSNLTEITLEEGLSFIGRYAFDGCSGLQEISIPESVTSIRDYAFTNCAALTDVYYEGSPSQFGLISIGSDNAAFLNATRHFSIEENIAAGESGGISWVLNGKGVLTISGSGDLTTYGWSSKKNNVLDVVFDADSDIRSIGNSAFYDHDYLRSVTIAGGVEAIGNSAFGYCNDNV